MHGNKLGTLTLRTRAKGRTHVHWREEQCAASLCRAVDAAERCTAWWDSYWDHVHGGAFSLGMHKHTSCYCTMHDTLRAQLLILCVFTAMHTANSPCHHRASKKVMITPPGKQTRTPLHAMPDKCNKSHQAATRTHQAASLHGPSCG
eukprot:scaffold53209_cov21-Tisochrysis_lutea.AAC.2